MALDLPRKDQCLDMISLKLGLALLYVVINIRGAVVSFLPVESSNSDFLLTLLVFCQASPPAPLSRWVYVHPNLSLTLVLIVPCSYLSDNWINIICVALR